jgi:heterodisulfide reductase subunit B
MKQYSYYPSCCLHGDAVAYDLSTRAVAKSLDIELLELDQWNCCGSTPFTGIDQLGAICCATRNLALAEKTGLEMVTCCSDCYLMFKKADSFLKEYPKLKANVDEALAAGGLEYHGTVKIRHILDVFANDVDSNLISSKVKKNLAGLKVAPYYGCQVVRPKPGFDHPEFPQSLERLIKSLGAEPTPFPIKTRCCGGSTILAETDACLELLHKILKSAVSNGANCVATVCAFCQLNLDLYQSWVNRKFKTNINIPILFFTQLMGVALGLGYEELGLERGIVPTKKVLAGYLSG